MVLDQIFTEVIELLQNPQFKNFGALAKHKYQMSKSEEDRENRRFMYEGTVGNSDAAKVSHITRKKNNNIKDIEKKAKKKRKDWYKKPENYEKFMKIMEKRDKKNKKKEGKS